MENQKKMFNQKQISLFLRKNLTHEKSLHELLKRQPKFKILYKERLIYVQVFFYQLVKNRISLFGFLFPEFWGNETEFLNRYQVSNGGSSWNESLQMVFISKMILPLELFLNYLCFYQYLIAEISLIPPDKMYSNIVQFESIFEYYAVSSRDIENIINQSKYFNLFKKLIYGPNQDSQKSKKESSKESPNLSFLYLILPVYQNPLWGFQIDDFKIQNYMEFLLTLERTTQNQTMRILQKNTLVKAIYGGKACYVVSTVIKSPKIWNVNSFFKELQKQFPQFTIDFMENYFEISKENSLKMTFDEFLHSGKSSRKNISKYRDVSERCGIPYNRSDPVYVLRTMRGWRSLKFSGLNSFQSENLGNKVKNLNLILLSCSHIKKHFFDSNEIKSWMELPYLLSSFHLNWQSRNFWKFIKIKPNSDIYLQQSLAIKAFNQKYNLETLETLGDSILKFLVTFYLYYRFEKANESILTTIR
jgi:hypothetical protein